MQDFDFIEMEYRAVGTNEALSRVIWRVSDFVNYTHPSTGVGGVIEANYYNGAIGVRLVTYSNDTTINVGQYGTVAGASVSNYTRAIPTKVNGIKFVSSSGTNFLAPGNYMYMRYTYSTITASELGVFVKGVAKGFSQYVACAILVNCEDFSTVTINNGGSSRAAGIAYNNDGTISNLASSNTPIDISSANYIMLSATTSGSQTFTITFN